jgi:ankyrin repeat protein
MSKIMDKKFSRLVRDAKPSIVFGVLYSKEMRIIYDARDNLDYMKFLIEKRGYDPNLRDVFNYTPLHHVSDVEIAKYLLSEGAKSSLGVVCDGYKCGEPSQRPLEKALCNEHMDLAQLYMQAMETPLLFQQLIIKDRKEFDDATIEEIMEPDFLGDTLIHYLQRHDPEENEINIQFLSGRLLIEKGMDVDTLLNNEGKSPSEVK